MLNRADIKNFETLKTAAANGDLALVQSTDAKTGEYRALICAMRFQDGEYVVTPLGHMATGNPYEDYSDPTQ